MTEQVIIIGSGPAGWAAAIYAARANLLPLVYEGAITEPNRIAGTLPLGQLNLTTEVENYPGFPAGNLTQFLDTSIVSDVRDTMPPHSGHGVSGPELMELMRQQAKNFGTRIITDDIIKVEFGKHPFVLHPSQGDPVETQTVIVATGARANYLGLPSEEIYKNRGVSACAVCDGALPRFRNKPLVVVGGGDSAVEEGSYLSKYASVVHMVLRRDQFRASKIMQDRARSNPKINIRPFRVIDEVLGDAKNGVTAVRLKSTQDSTTEVVETSGLFLAIGHTPNTDFLDGQLELNAKKYVQWTTPQRTFTSVDGVFAAGDVGDDYYRQAITAAGSGCMAALDAERWLAAKGIH